MDRILNAEEFAALIKVSRGALYQMHHQRLLPPAIRVGARLRWKLSDIQKWMDDHMERSR